MFFIFNLNTVHSNVMKNIFYAFLKNMPLNDVFKYLLPDFRIEIMGKNKTQKYALANELENVIISEFTFDGKLINHDKNWDKNRFKGKDVILELGCGKGEYTLNLAKKHPDKVCIGVDVKSNRIVNGALGAIDQGLDNVLFIRTLIYYLDHFFEEASISEIWITFADPQPTKKGIKKRLTSQTYLDLYKRLIVPGGVIHLKTDSTLLYEFSLDLVKENDCIIHCATDDLYDSDVTNEDALTVKSAYEIKFLPIVKTIKYMEFSFKN